MPIMKDIEDQYGKFAVIRENVSAEKIGKFSSSQYEKLLEIFKNKDYLKNVEWIGRHYLASKKMSLAALYFTQSQTLLEQGMKNLSFYSCYYSLFSALSANLLVNTDFKLENVRTISHNALSRDIENYYVRPEIYSKEVIELLAELRFCRELYSYHLPISGRFEKRNEPMDAQSLHDRLGEILPTCLQISELQSYLTYFAWEKKAGGPLDDYLTYQTEVSDFFWSIVSYKGAAGLEHFDDGDYSLLGYFIKAGIPMPITWIINDKVLEDVECSWQEEENESGYSITSVARYLARAIGA